MVSVTEYADDTPMGKPMKVMIESNARVQFGKFGDGDQERDAGGLTWLLGG